MPNYNQTSITGDSWTRAYQVIINNKFGITPSIMFNEENIVSTNSGTMSQHIGHISEALTDPSTQFVLKSASDDSVIGNTTYQDVHNILYSLYRHLTDIRDTVV